MSTDKDLTLCFPRSGTGVAPGDRVLLLPSNAPLLAAARVTERPWTRDAAISGRLQERELCIDAETHVEWEEERSDWHCGEKSLDEKEDAKWLIIYNKYFVSTSWNHLIFMFLFPKWGLTIQSDLPCPLSPVDPISCDFMSILWHVLSNRIAIYFIIIVGLTRLFNTEYKVTFLL